MDKQDLAGFLTDPANGVNHPERLHFRDMVKYIGGKPTVLDVACGQQVDKQVLGDLCVYTGVDKTPSMGVQVADIRELPFADKSFDIVRARAIFEHLPNVDEMAKAIRECARCASGILYLAFYMPTEETRISWNGSFFENSYSRSDIVRCLGSVEGFSGLDRTFMGPWPDFTGTYTIYVFHRPPVGVQRKQAPQGVPETVPALDIGNARPDIRKAVERKKVRYGGFDVSGRFRSREA